MTRKDYDLIARIFAKNISDTDPKVMTRKYTAHTVNIAMAKQFADVLKMTNPNFDHKRFLEACGVEA